MCRFFKKALFLTNAVVWKWSMCGSPVHDGSSLTCSAGKAPTSIRCDGQPMETMLKECTIKQFSLKYQLLLLRISHSNHCQYCWSSHGLIIVISCYLPTESWLKWISSSLFLASTVHSAKKSWFLSISWCCLPLHVAVLLFSSFGSSPHEGPSI